MLARNEHAHGPPWPSLMTSHVAQYEKGKAAHSITWTGRGHVRSSPRVFDMNLPPYRPNMDRLVDKNTDKHYVTNVFTYVPSLIMTAEYSRVWDDTLVGPKITSQGYENRKRTWILNASSSVYFS